jgi:hypothetical protein
MNDDAQSEPIEGTAGGCDLEAEEQGTVLCEAWFEDGKWLFSVPGEGKVAAKDSKQVRGLVEMMLNLGIIAEPDDIEDGVATGPSIIHGGRRPEDEPSPVRAEEAVDVAEANDEDSQDSEGAESPSEGDDTDEEATESIDADVAIEGAFTSASDPELLMLYGVRQPRHTGDAGDYRLVHGLDRRVADLNRGIKEAKSRRNGKLAASLVEERTALRKDRNGYMNPITGKLKPFYSKEADDKAHRCRMWIVRGLQALAKAGLPKAAASLMVAIDRGMEFIYRKQPGYVWVVTLPPPGTLRVFPKAGGSGVAE